MLKSQVKSIIQACQVLKVCVSRSLSYVECEESNCFTLVNPMKIEICYYMFINAVVTKIPFKAPYIFFLRTENSLTGKSLEDTIMSLERTYLPF